MTPEVRLNENQAAAVAWDEGPALVLAGPGSGKTAVLTVRASRILVEKPEISILALTFTSKAAAEMRDRLDLQDRQRADRAHLCTFHSFATDILRQHGSHLGLRPDFTLLSNKQDRLELLEDSIRESGTPSGDIPEDREAVLKMIDRLYAESYEGGELALGLPSVPHWLPGLFSSYNETLLHGNRLDFGALLHFARRLLTSRTGVAAAVRMAWSYYCVDEFQDTNRAQYDLLKLVVGKGSPNLFVVGDDDQLIYQFNGASPERLTALQSDYSMQVFQLPQSYRCPPAIVDLANSLIKFNPSRRRGKLPLVASRGPESAPTVYLREYDNPEEEGIGIAADIINRGLTPGECVVLGRAGSILKTIQARINARGLPTYVAQTKTDFEAAPIRWLFNVLRLANARHDREILRRLCVAWQEATEFLISADDVVAASALVGGDFLRAWHQIATSNLPDDEFTDLLELIRKNLIDRLDYLAVLAAFNRGLPTIWANDPLAGEELTTWQSLHHDVLHEYGAEGTPLHLYLQELELRSKAPQAPTNAIRLFTIHRSKGLEFRHVFLVGMSEDLFPSFQSTRRGDESREMEEERRNCFVAITRTQETLTLTRSRAYFGYQKAPSRFLREMGLPFQSS